MRSHRSWSMFGAAWDAALSDCTPAMMFFGWCIAIACLIDFVRPERWLLDILVVVPISVALGIVTVFGWFLSYRIITTDPVFLRRGIWIPLVPFVVFTPVSAAYAIGMAINGVETRVALAFIVALPLLLSVYVTAYMVFVAIVIGPLLCLFAGLRAGQGIAIVIFFVLLLGTPVAGAFSSDWIERRFGDEVQAFWDSDNLLIRSLRVTSTFAPP